MINTRTLTCSHCGSAEFVRVGQNEYRCKRCESVTLVEDDVAVRLEQLLLSMQRPQREMNSLLIAATVVGALAIIAVLTFMFVVSGNAKPGSGVSGESSFRQPINPDKIKIEPLRKVYTADGANAYLLGRLRNESDAVIPGPRLSVVLYAHQTKLNTYSASVSADYLRPGEYSVFKVRLPDDVSYTRYEVGMQKLYPASEKPRAMLNMQKNQLVLSGKSLQLIGQIRNPGTIAARHVHVNVMLYDRNKQLIGFGDGKPESAELKPGEQTAFQVSCEMFSHEPVASYDYLIESEHQS